MWQKYYENCGRKKIPVLYFMKKKKILSSIFLSRRRSWLMIKTVELGYLKSVGEFERKFEKNSQTTFLFKNSVPEYFVKYSINRTKVCIRSGCTGSTTI